MKKTRIHKLVRTARKRITALYTGGVLGTAALVFVLASMFYIGHVLAYTGLALDGGGGGSYKDVPTDTLPSDTAPPSSTTNVTSTYTNSNGSVTGRSVWNTTPTVTLWYAWNRGTLPSSDTTTTGWATGLANPNISIGYDYSVYDYNNPSTIINPGSSVQSGQKIILKFNPYTSDNIFWFGTGSSMDSPYGEWRAGATAPARVGSNVTCVSKDLVQQYTYTDTYNSTSYQFDVYVPFVVNPPDRSLDPSSLNGLSCGALTTNSDGSASAVCTVTATSGSISPAFNYTATNGIFYYRYYDYRDMTSAGWGGPGCYGNNIALTSGDASGFGNPSGPSANSTTSIAPPYVVNVPSQSFPYSLSVTPITNQPPTAPTVTCSPSPVNINTDVNVALTSTDPQNQNVSYGVDWTGGSTVNSGWTAPVPSGTSQTITKTGGFAAPGTYTVTGFAKDTSGSQSTGSSCTFTVTAAAPTVSLTATPGSVNPGGSATLAWTSTGATSCTGTNFSTGGATSGSVSTGALSATQMYSVSCTGPGGNASDSAQVTVNTAADLTAGGVSLSNGSPVAGTGLSLTAQATNIGNSPSGSFPVLFQVQDSAGNNVSMVDSSYLAGLAVGASAPASIPYTFSAAGAYQVRACANENTSMVPIVTESNYANNCGGWTSVTVAPPAPTGALSCTVSNQNPTPGTTITYTVTPSNGATGPYTWNDTQGGSYGTGATASRLIPSTGSYVMNVSGQNVAQQPVSCPVVTGGCGTPSGSITATPNRVRANDTTTPITITWSASGVNTSCTLSGPGVPGGSQTVPANSCSVGNQTATIPSIAAQSVYTVTCGGTVVGKAIVNVIPAFQEF